MTLLSALDGVQDESSGGSADPSRYVDVAGAFAASAQTGVSDTVDEESQT